MTIMTKAAKVAVAAVLASALAGCASASWPDMPWSKPKAQLSCFWMVHDGSRWEPMPQVQTKAECFALDSCSGGKGLSGGGCYKWAKSKDAPGVKW